MNDQGEQDAQGGRQEQQGVQAGGQQAVQGGARGPTNTTTTGGKPRSPNPIAKVIGLDPDVQVDQIIGTCVLYSLIFGLLLAALGGWSNWVSALLWSVTCSAVGWVLGFLFGIPRTLQTEGQSEVPPTKSETLHANTTRSVPARRTTGVNTNLEQISDWLTKILVGVTLVQLDKIAAHLDSAAVLIAESLGGSQKSFAYALMLYFSLTGFLGSYLLTRLFLQRAFEGDNAISQKEPH